jgi:hypothetical protein
MSDVEVDDERENVEEPQEDVEENAEGEDDDEVCCLCNIGCGAVVAEIVNKTLVAF